MNNVCELPGADAKWRAAWLRRMAEDMLRVGDIIGEYKDCGLCGERHPSGLTPSEHIGPVLDAMAGMQRHLAADLGQLDAWTAGMSEIRAAVAAVDSEYRAALRG